MVRDSRLLKFALLSSVSAVMCAGLTANAQDTDADEAGADDVIVVTSSAASRIEGFDAPSPVTTVSQEQLQNKAVFRLSDLIVDVPAFLPNQNIGRFSAPIGASNFDLRGLGPARTLVLIDGRRVSATDPTGAFDTNIIPATLIKNIEVVTGGASAAYGSDAVAGVVSIALDDEFVGFKGDLQYGISGHNDVKAPSASLAYGHASADDKFHLVAALDIYDNEGQLSQGERDWGDDSHALFINPDGPPARLRIPNTRFSQLTYGGVAALNNIPELQGIQFGPGGTVLPFNYGQSVGSLFMIGGDGDTLSDDANIYPELSRESAYARVTYDIADNVEFFADALWAHVDAWSDSAYVSTNRAPIAISIENPFLPDEVADIMVMEGVDTFYLGRLDTENGYIFNQNEATTGRYAAGLEGDFGAGWSWDAVVQFSTNEYEREDGNNVVKSRYALGADVVTDPMSGDPICRSTLNNPGSTDPDIANCVPINFFGLGSVTEEALAYYSGSALSESTQEQTLVAANLSGSLFSMPAGDVSIAVGAEYREDSIDATSDPISQVGGWFAVNPSPLSGEVEVTEAYAEVVVPLLANQPGAYLLDTNGAVRLTNYSTSGNVTTWKFGANYSPVPELRFRATVSHDIRAPRINELFSGQNEAVRQLLDPRDGSNPTVPLLTGGNPDLEPETSDAFTGGVVYTPSTIEGLKLSLDYYSFEIEDAVASLDEQSIVNGCYVRMQTSLCDNITLNPDNSIASVQATLLNVASAKAEGWDFEAAYSFPAWQGDMDLRLLSNYVSELSTTVDGVTTDLVGQLGSESSGGIAEWRHVVSANYRKDGFTGGVLVRYISDGNFRNAYVEGVDIEDNDIPSRTYVDLNLSQELNDNWEVYFKVNNVFDVDPPLAPNPITQPAYNGSAFHDRIGRYFKVGARFEF